MNNSGHLGELHVIVWAIICNNKKHHERTVTQTECENMVTCKKDSILYSVSEFFKKIFKTALKRSPKQYLKKTFFDQLSNDI